MRRGLRLIIGLSVALIAGGFYFVSKTFTGAPIGAVCNSDDDCKGLSAVCMIGDGNAKYCTTSCTSNAGCPNTWTCEDVQVTNVDGSGHTTSTSSTKLCALPPTPPPATTK